jgi:hypothetical protein
VRPHFYSAVELGLILIFPFFFTLLASGLHLYPFGDRLLLFIVPLVLIVITEGWADRLLTIKYRWVSLGSWGVFAFLLLSTPVTNAYKLFDPDQQSISSLSWHSSKSKACRET